MRKYIYIPVFFTLILFASCNDSEQNIQGTWAIDQAYYYNEPVIWDLYGNALCLKEDNICNLPIVNFEDRNTNKETGTWKVYSRNKKKFLEFSTKNRIFNRTFEIHNLRKIRDTISWGYLIKMTLTSDSLKLDCTKPSND